MSYKTKILADLFRTGKYCAAHLLRANSAARIPRSSTSAQAFRFVRGSQFRSIHNERGQVLVIGVIVIMGLFMISIAVANIGMMVAEKMHVQDTVDAAAYSAATMEARYMNLAAYLNRAMIANYDVMAFNTGLWATIDADDHGLAVLAAVVYEIAFILDLIPFTKALAPEVDLLGDGIDAVHEIFHDLNQTMNDLFAQDDSAQDLNKYIEMMNTDILTTYLGLLYAAQQSSRYEVARDVAKKMDPDVLTTSVMGLGAEAVSYDELAKAVDWVVRDPDIRGGMWKSLNRSFNKMAGTDPDTDDHEVYLTATTEASLDPFGAGRYRNGDKGPIRYFRMDDIIPNADWIEAILDGECYVECGATFGWLDGDCGCNSEFEVNVGPYPRWAQENDADQKHVPAITRRRMREVNVFGVEAHVNGAGFIGGLAVGVLADVLTGGHTSADEYNDVCNVGNSYWGPQAGENAKAWCMYPLGLSSMNVSQAMITGVEPPIVVDDHWDGTLDPTPNDLWEPYPPMDGASDAASYASKVYSSKKNVEQGVPKYDWAVDLDNVGFPLYIYPDTGASQRPAGTSGGGGNNNLLAGPSIAIVGIKDKSKLRGLHGLGIGNDYSITAMARSQVYYVRNPNRPEEKPSLFNPHWVPRLAPIESEDTPPLLRYGLPYIGSFGLPVAPTH